MKEHNIFVLLIFATAVSICLYASKGTVYEAVMKNNNYTLQETVMDSRADDLNKKCEKIGLKSDVSFLHQHKSRLKHIVVNDRYKIMFCWVPKVACTTLLYIFRSLYRDKFDPFVPIHQSKKSFPSLDSFSNKGIEYRIKNYLKVVFVRDPLERLLSAYRDKFVFSSRNNIAWKKIGFRNRSLGVNEATSKFPEFVNFIIHQNDRNDHWDLYNNLCFPCQIRYNFIGRFESLKDDAKSLLKIIGLEKEITFPERDSIYQEAKTGETMSTFYNTLSHGLFLKLTNLYQVDYDLFSYRIPEQ